MVRCALYRQQPVKSYCLLRSHVLLQCTTPSNSTGLALNSNGNRPPAESTPLGGGVLTISRAGLPQVLGICGKPIEAMIHPT